MFIACFACSIQACADKRKRNVRKPRAAVERRITDALNAIGNRDAHKFYAAVERIRADARYAVGYCDACKFRAIVERRSADSSDR